jgi:hypothetical protein
MSRAALGPGALAQRLGLADWQISRARRDGLLPPMDRSKGWSADLADQIAAAAGPLRAAIGEVPDAGAFNAAKHLGQRFGIEVDPDTVHELGRLGHLTVVDWHKEYPVYDGRSIEAFNDRAVLDKAAADGVLLTSDDSARHLEIRRADLDHLVRSGRLKPARFGRSEYLRSRDAANVSLFRIADLNAVEAENGDIDWAAVRATQAGHRSPLAKLPTAPTEPDR